MIRRDIEQLAIYQINEETDTLSVECLRDLYLKKTSEIIYIMKDGRLYGIVSSGDILRHLAEPETGAKVNKAFTALNNYNVIKAHEIFRERNRIHKIPIVNARGGCLVIIRDGMIYFILNEIKNGLCGKRRFGEP